MYIRVDFDMNKNRNDAITREIHEDYSITLTKEIMTERNNLSRQLNEKSRELGDLKCQIVSAVFERDQYQCKMYRSSEHMAILTEVTQKGLVNDVGGYCERSKHMGADLNLCRTLSHFLKDQVVASFGDGTGEYKDALVNMAEINTYEAFDGGPYTEKETSGNVKFIDLSIPQYGLKLYDWILSIEVAEHIPEQFEDIFLNNLFRHAKKGIILSWAVPGQGGISHVNNKPLEYVFKKMKINGFSVNKTSSKILQAACTFEHLKRNLHVYQRDNTDKDYLHLFI